MSRTVIRPIAIAAIALLAASGCVQLRAPEEPITINLNVKLDAEVRVKLEETAEQDIAQNPDLF